MSIYLEFYSYLCAQFRFCMDFIENFAMKSKGTL